MLSNFFVKRNNELLKALTSDTNLISKSLSKYNVFLIFIAECTKHALDAVVLSKNDRKIYEVNKEKLRKEAEHLTKVYQ